MTDTEPDPTAAPSAVEGTSIPVLPARDIPETLALFEQFGFTVRHDEDNEYAMVRRGTIELHFTASPNLDPWNGAGIAFVRLNDAAALYEEFLAAGVVPLRPCRARSSGPPSAFVTSSGPSGTPARASPAWVRWSTSHGGSGSSRSSTATTT